MNKKAYIQITSLAMASVMSSGLLAEEIFYHNDFSASQVVKPMYNGNVNYVGTGMAEDLNYGEWFQGRKRTGLKISHDATNELMYFEFGGHGESGWYLIDSSMIDTSKIGEELMLSFRVTNFTGQLHTVTLSVWDGKGLEFSGNRNSGGHVVVKNAKDLPIVSADRSNSPGRINVLHEGAPIASTKLAGNGTTSIRFKASALGAPGDFLLIGWGVTTQPKFGFQIDNVSISLSDGEPLPVDELRGGAVPVSNSTSTNVKRTDAKSRVAKSTQKPQSPSIKKDDPASVLIRLGGMTFNLNGQ